MEQLFSQAFDVFSDVQHHIQKRADVALGHDAPNWGMKYSCPACGFEVSHPMNNMLQLLYCHLFSNQMRNTWFWHGCMPLMAVILKSMTR